MRKHTYDFSYVLPSCLCGDSLICRECSFPPPPQSPTSKGKGKVLPITGHEGPKWEQTYSSTLPSTLALDGGGLSAPRRGRFTLGKDRVPIVQEARWAPEPVWTGAENLAPTGFRSPDRPARSESLYRLSYPGPCISYQHPVQISSLEVCDWLVQHAGG